MPQAACTTRDFQLVLSQSCSCSLLSCICRSMLPPSSTRLHSQMCAPPSFRTSSATTEPTTASAHCPGTAQAAIPAAKPGQRACRVPRGDRGGAAGRQPADAAGRLRGRRRRRRHAPRPVGAASGPGAGGCVGCARRAHIGGPLRCPLSLALVTGTNWTTAPWFISAVASQGCCLTQELAAWCLWTRWHTCLPMIVN